MQKAGSILSYKMTKNVKIEEIWPKISTKYKIKSPHCCQGQSFGLGWAAGLPLKYLHGCIFSPKCIGKSFSNWANITKTVHKFSNCVTRTAAMQWWSCCMPFLQLRHCLWWGDSFPYFVLYLPSYFINLYILGHFITQNLTRSQNILVALILNKY